MENTAQEFDLEVFKYHNLARTDPKSFIPKLEESLTHFEGKLIKRPELGVNLMTKEGPAAVKELITFLEAQEPMAELEWQQEMMPASRDHVLDTGPTGKTGCDGTDGSNPSDRQSRYVKLEGFSGENIDYGEKEPLDVIMALMIDDGVPGRGHRTNIFNKQFKKMSCFTGDHKVYKK